MITSKKDHDEFPVKIICFYTLNTPYEQEVIHLQNSCSKFALANEIDPIKSRGSWEKNIAVKPSFILEKLRKTNRPLLWVDADAMFLQKPDFTAFARADFSVRFMEVFKDNPQYAVSAGTIFINNTKAAHRLVEEWVDKVEELKKQGTFAFVDQVALYEILKTTCADILPMPVSYCKIFDLDCFFIDDKDVVIEHRQASRRYR